MHPNIPQSDDLEAALAAARHSLHAPRMPSASLPIRLRTSPALRRLIPTRLAVARAEARGEHHWRTSPATRNDALRALQAIVGATERAAEAEQLAHRWVIEEEVQRTLFWQPWRTAKIDARSLENLNHALSSGRGLLFSNCHMGPMHLHISALDALGLRIYAVSAPWFFEQPSNDYWGRRLAHWWKRLEHQRKNERVVYSPGSIPVLSALLQAREHVLIYFDMPGGRSTPFLGKPVMLATGTARMAIETGSPIVPLRARRVGASAWTDVGAANRSRRLPRRGGAAGRACRHARTLGARAARDDGGSQPSGRLGGWRKRPRVDSCRARPTSRRARALTPSAAAHSARLSDMRVLFFNEGNLGSHIMGQGQLAQALRTGLPFTEDVQARFAGLSPMGRVASAAASRRLAPLAESGMDFATLRWHLVQSLRTRHALTQELKQWPADVLHVHSHSVTMALGAKLRSLPLALSVDATVRDWSTMPAWRSEHARAELALAPSAALERRTLECAGLTLAWTAWTRAAVERAAPRAQVVEHHPGLDLERYRPAPPVLRLRPRVLFVGGRFVEKGGEDLLAALGEQIGETVDVDLVTPAEVAPRRGLRVHRLGPSDPQLLELQQQADLFCLPTHGDAVPWAVLEAMACGTPVLSTRIGAIPDLLDDGRAGALIAHGDRRALREALDVLLADAPARDQLAARARERCEQRYDARRQVPKLIEQLRQLVPAVAQAG